MPNGFWTETPPRPKVGNRMRALLVFILAGLALAPGLLPQPAGAQSNSITAAPLAEAFPAGTNAYALGQAEAQRDLTNGLLEVKSYGDPAPATEDYAKILKTRYQVEFRTVAGCVVTPERVDNWRGYNDVMMGEIKRRYGKDALDQAWQDAQQASEARLKPPVKEKHP